MELSIVEMSYNQLMDHKLQLHHLHRDRRIDFDKTTDPKVKQRLYYEIHRIDVKLNCVYSELERRKPGGK
jgi:hypothetical protein